MKKADQKTNRSYPENQDFIIRQVNINSIDVGGAILYLDGMIKKERLENNIIKPIVKEYQNVEMTDQVDYIIEKIEVNKVKKIDDISTIKQNILAGFTAGKCC
ncbi:MAG: spore germination protein [Halanaerobiales bacterium]